MKIQLLSDLHLEAHPWFQPRPAPGADVLVLAGDIGSYQRGSRLPDADFGLARFSPQAGWPTPVLFLPGNHEYDALDFDEAHARLRETCDAAGLDLAGARGRAQLARCALRRHHLVERLRRTGACAGRPVGDPRAAAAGPRQGVSRSQLLPAQDRRGPRRGSRCSPSRCANWRWSARPGWSRRWPRPFAGTTVVVTHFAPSLRSADPRYGLTPARRASATRWTTCWRGPGLWLHGHLHCAQRLPAPWLPRGGQPAGLRPEARAAGVHSGHADRYGHAARRQRELMPTATLWCHGPDPATYTATGPTNGEHNMKILLAVDGSRYTKKMLGYLVTHEETFTANNNEFTLFTAHPPLPPRARTALGKDVVGQLPRRRGRACAGAGIQVPCTPWHRRQERLEGGACRGGDRQLRAGREIRSGAHGLAWPRRTGQPGDGLGRHAGAGALQVPVLLVR